MSERPALATRDQGRGPALVFIHGFLNDASVWEGVVAELSDQFRCISIDLPGHGQSEPTGPETYSRNLVLQDIRQSLDRLEIEDAVFVGHSLGGYLALALAIEDPERVVGLGLIGAGPGFRKPESRERWNDSVRSLASERELQGGLEEISMHVDSMVMDRMAEISVPAVVVVGERDRGFLASASVFEKHLNVVRHDVVDGAGHMVHAKAPEAVAKSLRTSFATSASEG